MAFGVLDAIVFVTFVVFVVGLGLYKSRKNSSDEDYFLAGRGLKWWLIGFSLIAANISSEQFVGMSGNAASHVGLAIASYEWMAAITLIVIAFGFLPYFLRAGIYTMPEFLEYRYNASARTIMAVGTLFIYMLLLGSVTYSGALTIRTMALQMGYDVSLVSASVVIGTIAMVYVAAGGLRACAWADLIQGSALVLGGGFVVYFSFKMLGSVEQAATIADLATGRVDIVPLAKDSSALDRFWELNRVRMNMFLPASDKVLPWTALLLGLWIPNFYYWGLNQYITQRTLGSKSLAEGQRGIVFAAFIKLLIPFVIVIPGIIAFNIFSKDMLQQGVHDNVSVLTRYAKANPSSQAVEVLVSPSAELIEHWDNEAILIAVLANQAAVKEWSFTTPFILPIAQDEFDRLSVSAHTVFESDDKSAHSVFPDLFAELKLFNGSVKERARQQGATIRTEKFIAYKYDTALGQLLAKVLPAGTGIIGFVLAALLGAIVSSLAAMLNAASTIFSMDIFKKYIYPTASSKAIVTLGRACVVVFAAVAIMLAPQLGNPKISNSIFTVIQESQGLISPGILAVFVFGLLIRRAPALAGVAGLVTNIITYGGIYAAGRYKIIPEIQFLNRMAICFALCLLVMTVMTLLRPLAQPIEFKQKSTLDLQSSQGAKVVGVIIVVLTLCLYVIFSPLGVAR